MLILVVALVALVLLLVGDSMQIIEDDIINGRAKFEKEVYQTLLAHGMSFVGGSVDSNNVAGFYVFMYSGTYVGRGWLNVTNLLLNVKASSSDCLCWPGARFQSYAGVIWHFVPFINQQ
jgi:hypothetical protein